MWGAAQPALIASWVAKFAANAFVATSKLWAITVAHCWRPADYELQARLTWSGSGWLWAVEPDLDQVYEVLEGNSDHTTEGPQLHHVNSALTALALAHEALGRSPSEPTRDIALGQSCRLTRLPESGEESCILVRVDRFFHGSFVRCASDTQSMV